MKNRKVNNITIARSIIDHFLFIEINHKHTIVPIHSPPPLLSSKNVVLTEQQTLQHHPRSTNRNVRTKKSGRSVVVVSPNEPTVTVVTHSPIKEEPLQPLVVKHSKSFKKTRFEDEFVCQSYEKQTPNSSLLFSFLFGMTEG